MFNSVNTQFTYIEKLQFAWTFLLFKINNFIKSLKIPINCGIAVYFVSKIYYSNIFYYKINFTMVDCHGIFLINDN